MNRNFVFAMTLLSTAGCATILQSGPDRFLVDSNPKGATVFIDEQAVGQTPVMAYCNRSSECRIRVEKEGYNPFFADKDKVLSGWFIGNVIIGGGIGVIVDLIAHNQGHYQDDPLYVNMSSVTPEATRAPSAVETKPVSPVPSPQAQ